MQLNKIEEILALNHNAVFATFRKSGAAQMSIVTVGIIDNTIAFTVSPGSAKLANLKRDPRCSLLISRSDWGDYAVIEGQANLLSPGVTSTEDLRSKLREVYRAASGKEHPDWEEFDQAVQKDQRSAIIVVPGHIYYGNAG